MKTNALKKHGVMFVEGQRHGFSFDNQVHKRSYICVCMKKDLFIKVIQPCLGAYGVRYLFQTETLWDMSAFGGRDGEVWVTKVRGEGRVRIELLTDTITIAPDEIYVVMWAKHFLPTVFKRARPFDMDIILLRILEGHKRPLWLIWRVLGSYFLLQ